MRELVETVTINVLLPDTKFHHTGSQKEVKSQENPLGRIICGQLYIRKWHISPHYELE